MAMPQMYMAKPKDIHESDRQGTVGDEDYQSACKLPFNVLQKGEPLLERVVASEWARVISDNQLFRQLISSYFRYPDPCGPFCA